MELSRYSFMGASIYAFAAVTVLIEWTCSVGGDHGYFEYPPDPKYSYVEAATNAGYATISYDRLGTISHARLSFSSCFLTVVSLACVRFRCRSQRPP